MKYTTIIALSIILLINTGCYKCRNESECIKTAKSHCSEFGYKQGTPEYIQCVENNYHKAKQYDKDMAERYDRFADSYNDMIKPTQNHRTKCNFLGETMSCTSY